MSIRDKNIFYVYAYERRIDGEWLPFYIGKGHGDRDKHHLRAAKKGENSHRANIIRKCWRNDVPLRIRRLRSGLTEKKAFRIEMNRIAKYGRKVDGGILVNKTVGGEGVKGYRWTLEQRKSIVGRSMSKETRNKISVTLTGREFSDDHRRKLSDMAMGRKFSKITRKKLSKALIGQVLSKATRAKISKSSSGCKNASAKLSEKAVYTIRRLFDKGVKCTFIMKKFEISESSVYRIGKRQSWKSLSEKDSRQ